MSWSPKVYAALRVVTGLGFLHHGTSKLLSFPPFPYPMDKTFLLAGVLELVGGIAILVGLCVRPVAFILSGMMAVAYFVVHAPESIFPSENGGEAAMLYCFIFLLFAAQGAGSWSVDDWIERRKKHD